MRPKTDINATEALCNDLSQKKLSLLEALFSDLSRKKLRRRNKLKTEPRKLRLPEARVSLVLQKGAQKKAGIFVPRNSGLVTSWMHL